MPKFALLLHESSAAYKGLGPEEIQQIIQRYIEWTNRLKREGKFVSGDKLMPAARHVRRRGAELESDGPFVESKELLGGLMIIEAVSYDEAVQQTRDSPHFERGWIEVRQVDYT
jgi:hypothetical protein